MARLIENLDPAVSHPDVLAWACPVPFFGEIGLSEVATVGINPSNREFVGTDGRELDASNRRLATLTSLQLNHWNDASGLHVREVARSCEKYFSNNPYRLWFDVLERMLRTGGASYYGGRRACHIDLVAFATANKWGELGREVQRDLVHQGRRAMAELIRDSPVNVLVLNGRAVVREFEQFADVALMATVVDDWTLPRASGKGVTGIAYSGMISAIAGVELDRAVTVVGYNHNLQSSFGVTSTVMRLIGDRVGELVATANTN